MERVTVRIEETDYVVKVSEPDEKGAVTCQPWSFLGPAFSCKPDDIEKALRKQLKEGN